MAQIVIVSGPAASGKSSVCESLCERYDRTVHMRSDDAYAWIKMGFVRPWLASSDRQNRMVTRAVARAATAYAEELFAVFIDGVIGPHLLPIYLEELRAAKVPVHVVVLLPSLDETVRRGLSREPATRVPEGQRVPEEQLRSLHAQFVRYGEFAGCRIDNTRMTADQTGDLVMAACGRGECLVLPG